MRSEHTGVVKSNPHREERKSMLSLEEAYPGRKYLHKMRSDLVKWPVKPPALYLKNDEGSTVLFTVKPNTLGKRHAAYMAYYFTLMHLVDD